MTDQIIKHIKIELLNNESLDLTAEEDILTTGLIDSLSIMKLISWLEEHFSVTIPAEDMTIEYFMTVNDIADYIAMRQAALSA